MASCGLFKLLIILNKNGSDEVEPVDDTCVVAMRITADRQ